MKDLFGEKYTAEPERAVKPFPTSVQPLLFAPGELRRDVQKGAQARYTEPSIADWLNDGGWR